MKSKLQNSLLILLMSSCAVGLPVCLFLNMKADPERECKLLKEKAYASYKSGNLSEAEREYERALAEAEKSSNSLDLPATLTELSDVYEKSKKLTEAEDCMLRAVDAYEKLAKKNSEFDGEIRELILRKKVKAQLSLARIYRLEEKWDKAKDAYDRALRDDRKDTAAFDDSVTEEYAKFLRQQGDFALAEQIESSAAVDYASVGDFGKYFYRGNDFLMVGRLDDAEKLFRLSVQIAENHERAIDSVMALSFISVCKMAQGDFVAADSLLQRATEAPEKIDTELLRRRLAEAFQLYSFNLFCLGKSTESAKSFERAISLDPGIAAGLGDLGVLEFQYAIKNDQKQIRRLASWLAEKHEMMLSRSNVDSEQVLNSLATEASWILKPALAEKYLRQLAALTNRSADLNWLSTDKKVEFAQSFSKVKDFDNAERYWRLALQSATEKTRQADISRSFAYFLAERGVKGREGELKKLLTNSWNLSKDDDKSLQDFGGDLQVLGKCRESEGKESRWITLIRDTYSDYGKTWRNAALVRYLVLSIGDWYDSRKNYQGALEFYESFLSKDSGKHDLNEHAAKCRKAYCLQRLGRLDDAYKLSKELSMNSQTRMLW
ncbi:MAG: tetratricopeptide repeat protein, partial [Cyanobacteria bacterium]|nr:tetratricopeptide repeat protein [Cyanobacteriota bacterium]